MTANRLSDLTAHSDYFDNLLFICNTFFHFQMIKNLIFLYLLGFFVLFNQIVNIRYTNIIAY